MTESCGENRTLLYEEDQFWINSCKHLDPMVLKGRARIKAKGAAAIIRLWPDHWVSTVTVWWIALGMIAVIIFITYNSIIIVTASPVKYFKDIQRQNSSETSNMVPKRLLSSKSVFMHLVVDINTKVNLADYSPYIDVLISKYPEFNYNFYILINDSAVGTTKLSAKQNNENALNLLWPKDDIRFSNLSIYHLSLSEFIENTPLQYYWKNIMFTDYADFLIRAVSIWDKGGIAFNPRIITSWSDKPSYKEKLFNVFNKPHILNNKESMKQIKSKKNVNNIRDIIEALEEQESELPMFSIQDPIEAESTVTKYNSTIKEKKNDAYIDQNLVHNLLKKLNSSQSTKSIPTNFSNPDKLAMNFVFSGKPNIEIKTHKQTQKVVFRKRKHIISSALDNRNATDKDEENVRDITIMQNLKHYDEESNKLTVDLKGNILASELPCHVFLGSVFSRLNNLVNVSVADFILKELTYFCKNTILLLNCTGIKVIEV